MPVNLKSLISKMNDTTRKAMEGAAGLCLARTHYDVEIEHFLLKMLDEQDSDHLAHPEALSASIVRASQVN